MPERVEFAAILDRLAPGMAVCLDTGHTTLAGHWLGFVQAAGSRLAHVHAHDNHGYADDHLPPGDGVVDWSEIRASLAAISYEGWIMVELHCPHAEKGAHFKRAVEQTVQRLSG